MAEIRAFAAIRPKDGLESEVAALPYDVYSREEATEAVKQHPLSFLNIDRAETAFGAETDTYDPAVYERAHDLLWSAVSDGTYLREKQAVYYIYELTMEGRVQTGIVACASIDDYLNGVIKKHENTREDKELDRIRHVDVCNAQTGPIFLAYRAQKPITRVVNEKKKEMPYFDFTSEDGIGHRGWKIETAREMAIIHDTFAGLEEIYIADGHHRCASAAKVGQKRRAEHPEYTGDEEYNFFLSVLFPDDQLMIMDYNRVIEDLNGLTEEEFLKRTAGRFLISPIQEAKKPEKKGQMTMLLGKQWYLLEAKEEVRNSDPVRGLDVSILQDQLLHPLLGIGDPKTDQRISFVGGIRGLGELERRVSQGAAVAFAMYPTSIEELFAVADAGRLMPPKSTWFEPKLRSGLFIHEI